MKRIKLTKDVFALVDDADFDWLNQWKWHYSHGYAIRRQHIYVAKGIYKGQYIYMHRLIMGAIDKNVDHVNGVGIDNQRHNLRLATQKQNTFNRLRQSNNKSGYKGVYWNKFKKKWEASLTIHSRKVYIGRYDTPIEAAHAYDRKAFEYFGEFARGNFV